MYVCERVIEVIDLRMPFLRDHVKRGCIKQMKGIYFSKKKKKMKGIYTLYIHIIIFFSFEKNTPYFPFTIEYTKDHLDSDLQFGT